MHDEKLVMFHNRLAKVFRHIGKQARKTGVTCFRIYDHDLPEFPFRVEIYEENLYVAEYERHHGMEEDQHERWIEECMTVISDTLGIPAANIFLRLRKRKSGRLDQYQKVGQQQHEFIVRENGLQFIVNLTDYLDTGLFLDHRKTRQLVRLESAGKRVLNLFAYTGSFSVYAAAGDAASVVTTDLSNTYLNWARRNMQLNGFEDEARYQFVQADVKQYLQQVPAHSFDIIVMDPPTFSNSKKMKDFLDIQRDHVQMINECMRILSTGGVLYFSTNYTKFLLSKDEIHAKEIKDITNATKPFDFNGQDFRLCYRMK